FGDSVGRRGGEHGDHRTSFGSPARAALAYRDVRADLGKRNCWHLLLSFDSEHACGAVLRGGGHLRSAGAVLGAGDQIPSRDGGGGRNRNRELDWGAGGIRRAVRDRMGEEGNGEL